MKAYQKISIGARNPDLHTALQVAVGHLTVNETDIEQSFMGAPNASRRRKKLLSELLNDVVKHERQGRMRHSQTRLPSHITEC